jgi:hypothetical protein
VGVDDLDWVRDVSDIDITYRTIGRLVKKVINLPRTTVSLSND